MKFIRCHTLVHVFITGRRVLGRSTIFSCACERSPSWCWSERRLLLPYVYTRPLAQLASEHFLFLFCKVLPTLDISLRWLLSRVLSGNSHECSAPFLRVLSLINVSNFSGGGSEVTSNCFLIVTARFGFSVPSDLLGGNCSCIQVFDRLTSRLAELPWDLDCPSVSCDDRGSEISWLGLL